MDNIKHIRAVLDGNKSAFTPLVKGHESLVYSVCLKVLRDPNEAEDAAQESFIKAFNKLSSFDQKANFGTWIYSIAYRTSIDRYRQIRRKYEVDEELKTDMGKPENVNVNPGDQKDLKKWLNVALSEMEEDDRMILELFYLKEMNVKEVAKMTGFSESNVKVKLYRSRDKMKNKMLSLLGQEVFEL